MRKPLQCWVEDVPVRRASPASALRSSIMEPRDPRPSTQPWGVPGHQPLCEAAIQQAWLGTSSACLQTAARRPDGGAGPRIARTTHGTAAHRSRRSLRQTAQLLRLIEQFREAGIERCLQGSGVGAVPLRRRRAAHVGGPGSHCSSRADALLREVLLKNGFVDANRSILESWSETPRMGRTLRRKGFGLYLDVHWNVTVGFSAGSLPAERLLDGREKRASWVER